MNYTEPLLTLFLAIILVGLIGIRRRSAKLVWAGAIGLFMVSWPPASWLFSRPLEASYPIRPFSYSGLAQAIVVLSSAVEPPHYERPYPLADQQTYRRCEYAAWLYHQWRPLPILASGGRPGKRQPSISLTMRDLLERAGVPPNMIWTEERSRSTHENAVFGAETLHLHGVNSIVLVVDASSMKRASACFRKAGIEVIAAPSEFWQITATREDWLPGWRAVQQNELTLHETFGLAWYWLHGWV